MANILVVDDEAAVRNLLKGILTTDGYKCTTAVNAAEARNCLKESIFDLILSDINMPGESGLDFVRHALAELPDTAAIMVSAIDDQTTAKEALDIGISDFIFKPFVRNTVLFSVANALQRRELKMENRSYRERLETMVQQRTESLKASIVDLEKTQAALRESEEKFRTISTSAHDAIIMTDNQGKISYWNKAAEKMFDYHEEDMINEDLHMVIAPERYHEAFRHSFSKFQIAGQGAAIGKTTELTAKRKNGNEFPIELSLSAMKLKGSWHALGIIRDISERRIMEAQLVQAQKLESIGQLAAGIAHEINTPTQYVSYNTSFLKEKFTELNPLLDKYQALVEAAESGDVPKDLLQEINTLAEKVDLAFIREEIPPAINQSLEGVERVSEIVRAMKDFSHPGTEEKTPMDINKAIGSTITVATNEWKYVAEMVTDFDPNLPLVPCLPGDFNQVILNMVVNAAHAIGDVVGDGAKTKGTITIGTCRNDGWVEIRIADTGTGIADENRLRIFDPFFTTKKVGRGTGQGLAISHSVIVDKHGGTLSFETENGKGTTFVIRLPLPTTSG